MDHIPPIPSSPAWEPRISGPVFIGVPFFMMGLAIITSIVRTYLRVTKFRRVTVDDVLLIIALIGHIVAVVLAYRAAGLIYWTMYFYKRLVPPLPNMTEAMITYSILDNLSNIFAWGSIYLVKISFLWFLRSLVDRVRLIHAWWWVVFVFVVLSTPVTMFLGFYICDDFSDNIMRTCGATVIPHQRIFLIVNCCLDILSDALIISVPVGLLWKVRIHVWRKLALGCVLSLSMFMIVIAVIRAAWDDIPQPQGPATPDTPWLYFWTNVENSVAILMVSLTAFRSMLGQESGRSGYKLGASTAPSSSNVKAHGQRLSDPIRSPPKSPLPVTTTRELSDDEKVSRIDEGHESDDTLLPPRPGQLVEAPTIPPSPAVERSTSPIYTSPFPPRSASSSPQPESLHSSIRHPRTPKSGAVDPSLSAIRKEITIRTSFEHAPVSMVYANHASLPPLVNATPLSNSVHAHPYYTVHNYSEERDRYAGDRMV